MKLRIYPKCDVVIDYINGLAQDAMEELSSAVQEKETLEKSVIRVPSRDEDAARKVKSCLERVESTARWAALLESHAEKNTEVACEIEVT